VESPESDFGFQFRDDRLVQPSQLEARIPPGISTKADLLHTLDTSLHFPEYFGENWDALWECVCDLSWLDAVEVVLIHEDIPLSDQPTAAKTYLSILRDAVKYWGARPEHHLEVVFPQRCELQVRELLSDASSSRHT